MTIFYFLKTFLTTFLKTSLKTDKSFPFLPDDDDDDDDDVNLDHLLSLLSRHPLMSTTTG